MSSVFIHLFIPLLILLVFSKKLDITPKILMIMSIFSIIPDLDIVFSHRATLHNIFIPLFLMLIYYIWSNPNFLIVGYYWTSHILLDIFNAGVYILYPFYNRVLFIKLDLWRYINESGLTMDINTAYGFSDGLVHTHNTGVLITSEGAGVLIIFLIILIITITYNKIKIKS